MCATLVIAAAAAGTADVPAIIRECNAAAH
jgi:hypothetical protein